MAFRPNVNDKLAIDGVTYRFVEHPAIPGTPFGQDGRRATVYQLAGDDGKLYALKVFYETFRAPHIAESADRLRPFAKLPGLQVCERVVLTPDRHAALLRQHEDLVYAALMPWIKGELWQEIILIRRKFSPDLSQTLAHSLVRILAIMEQQKLAHCDLSGGNIMVVRTQGEVELIDVEDLYSPHLTQPTQLPGGSPGYAHREAPAGLWRAESDRFAGLVLLSEMICWFDPRIREQSYGEYFFDPQEMQRESTRLGLLRAVLRDHWGTAALETFERGWFSQKLNDCPSFQDWAGVLNIKVPRITLVVPVVITAPAPQQEAHALLRDAQGDLELGQLDQAIAKLEAAYQLAPALAERQYMNALRRRAATKSQGDDPRGALADYRASLAIAPANADRRTELEREIARLEQQVALLPPQPASQASMLPGEKERDQERKRILRSFILVYTAVGALVLLLALVFEPQFDSIYQSFTQGSTIGREIIAGGGLALLIGALYTWAFRATMRPNMIWQIVLATGAAGMVGGLVSGIIYEQLDTNPATTAIASAIGGAVAGALAGWIQATIRLRVTGARRRQWMLLGALSWSVIWCVGLTIGSAIDNRSIGDTIGWTIVLALNGAALALLGSRLRSLEL